MFALPAFDYYGKGSNKVYEISMFAIGALHSNSISLVEDFTIFKTKWMFKKQTQFICNFTRIVANLPLLYFVNCNL